MKRAVKRVLFVPPQTISARLGGRLALLTGGAQDLPARQQTLRATLEERAWHSFRVARSQAGDGARPGRAHARSGRYVSVRRVLALARTHRTWRLGSAKLDFPSPEEFVLMESSSGAPRSTSERGAPAGGPSDPDQLTLIFPPLIAAGAKLGIVG